MSYRRPHDRLFFLSSSFSSDALDVFFVRFFWIPTHHPLKPWKFSRRPGWVNVLLCRRISLEGTSLVGQLGYPAGHDRHSCVFPNTSLKNLRIVVPWGSHVGWAAFYLYLGPRVIYHLVPSVVVWPVALKNRGGKQVKFQEKKWVKRKDDVKNGE